MSAVAELAAAELRLAALLRLLADEAEARARQIESIGTSEVAGSLPLVMSMVEAARYAGVTRYRVREWLESGLEHSRTQGGLYQIPTMALDRFINSLAVS